MGCQRPNEELPQPPAHGRFVGRVRAELLDDGRGLRLLEDFGYVDPQEKLWSTPAGTEVDGASIPQVFWSLIGGPLEGKYRNASVVHDYECDTKREPWENVHRMFYDACLCGGADPWLAKVMFTAVHNFGPRWETRSVSEVRERADGTTQSVERSVIVTMAPPAAPTASQVDALVEFIKANDPSLDQLQQLDLSSLGE